MTDIVERLRYTAQIRAHHRSDTDPIKLECLEAADEITRLRAGNERLRAKIEHLSKEVNYAKYGNPDFAWSLYEAQMNDLRLENERLRAALEGYVCTCTGGECAEQAGYRDECGKPARAALEEKQ